jgi:hypothetical protein
VSTTPLGDAINKCWQSFGSTAEVAQEIARFDTFVSLHLGTRILLTCIEPRLEYVAPLS